ncbi:MAG: hypothetical protein WCL18_04820 [bacterium]
MVSYFWKMTMIKKRSFAIVAIGMVVTSLASLILPIYYTRIIDIVQTSSANRVELLPVLL